MVAQWRNFLVDRDVEIFSNITRMVSFLYTFYQDKPMLSFRVYFDVSMFPKSRKCCKDILKLTYFSNMNNIIVVSLIDFFRVSIGYDLKFPISVSFLGK